MATGRIEWHDLTVANAEDIRGFYQTVAGWGFEALSMGDYDDYCMTAPDGEVVAGVCHRRGSNSAAPAQWLMYIEVPDVEASARSCIELGGTVVDGPRLVGEQNFAVIQDPAGAVCAIIEPAKES